MISQIAFDSFSFIIPNIILFLINFLISVHKTNKIYHDHRTAEHLFFTIIRILDNIRIHKNTEVLVLNEVIK